VTSSTYRYWRMCISWCCCPLVWRSCVNVVEDVTTWANRLEDLLCKACQKNVVRREEMNEKLCSRFWSGLSQRLVAWLYGQCRPSVIV
jgi:hypothetical protein